MHIRSVFYTFFALMPLCIWGQQIDIDLTQFPGKPAANIAGSLWMQSGYYDVKGIPARTNNFLWSMGAQASTSLYGIDMPFAFTIGQFGSRFERPTFGQIGISPRYKWITGHIGHRNMHFSPYTLAGHTFLGAGVEMRPGKFRFAAMYGQFRSAQADQPNLISILPTYRRIGFGGKIGVGSESNFVDLIVFKGKDQKGVLPDTMYAVRPAENLILGISSRFQLAMPLTFYLDIAGSAFTRDINSRIFSGDSLSIDNYVPESIFTPRYSSRLNFAGKVGLRYSLPRFQIGLEYERIDPEYESMGAFFFMNDLENYTIAPSFSLWQNRVSISGSIGIQRNNLLGDRSESTHRFIGNSTLTYASADSPFGLSCNYSNFSINQTDGRLELSDTLRLTMVSNNIMIAPYWNWSDSVTAHNVMLTANYQSLIDRNSFTREFTDMNTLFFTGTYSENYFRSGLGWQIGMNYNLIEVLQLTTHRYGISAGINQSLGKGNFQVGLNGNYNLTMIEGERDGDIWSINLNAGWQPAKQWHLSAWTNVLRSNSEKFDNYTEYMGGLRLQWLFMTNTNK